MTLNRRPPHSLFVALSALLTVIILSTPAPAAEIAQTVFPDTLSVTGQELPLAGLGIRSKFVIRVYAAGLYLPAGAGEIATAVFADIPKGFRMHFLYSEVDGETLQEAWREGFAENTKDPSEDLRARMERFTALFTQPALRDDEYLFTYEPGSGTRVVLKGTEMDLIPGEDFMKALMGIWFGPEPADGGLKRSVLAGKK